MGHHGRIFLQASENLQHRRLTLEQSSMRSKDMIILESDLLSRVNHVLQVFVQMRKHVVLHLTRMIFL